MRADYFPEEAANDKEDRPPDAADGEDVVPRLLGVSEDATN